jgi:hypothetical protein
MKKELSYTKHFKTILLLLILIFGFKSNYAQSVTTYKTYNDYIREKGIDRGEYKKWKATTFGKVTLILEKEEKKVKVELKDIWGFEYKGELFRVFRGLYPAMMVDKGEMIFYENGIAHLEMLSENKTIGEFNFGAYSLFSFGLDGELIACPKQKSSSQPYNHFKKYRKTHPQYEGVLSCIEENDFKYRKVQQCIRYYNESLEKR